MIYVSELCSPKIFFSFLNSKMLGMGREDLKAIYHSLSDAFFCDNVCSRH